jgi:hypothetical protein
MRRSAAEASDISIARVNSTVFSLARAFTITVDASTAVLHSGVVADGSLLRAGFVAHGSLCFTSVDTMTTG